MSIITNNQTTETVSVVEYMYSNKYWYKNDILHREDGLAIEYTNGDKYWYKDGQFHRENGPAIEYANGDKYWYKNGLLHREDGSAVEYANGDKKYARIIGNYHIIIINDIVKIRNLKSNANYLIVKEVIPFSITESRLKNILNFI